VDYHLHTSEALKPRPKSMTIRLQARIPKMCMAELHPGYDAYVWMDASLDMAYPTTVEWFLAQLGDAEIAVFKHPHRSTLQEEIDFVRTKMARGSNYLLSRYEGEDLDGLEQEVARRGLLGGPLYASTAFIFRPTPEMRSAMKEWWYLTSRFHSIDQIQYTLVLEGRRVSVIDEDIYHTPHFKWAGHWVRL